MKGWFKSLNKKSIIRNVFLVPILLVVFMSISHVVSWYDIGNPISWAIYLSIAIEIFALASIAAASVRISKTSIWTLFGIVTSIQIIGNIFFTYMDIDITSNIFKTWVELISPLFDEWDIIEHRRLLATIQGGTLPMMSLIALYFYMSFDKENNKDPIIEDLIKEDPIIEDPIIEDIIKEDPIIEDIIEEDPITEDPIIEDIIEEDPIIEDIIEDEDNNINYKPKNDIYKTKEDNIKKDEHSVNSQWLGHQQKNIENNIKKHPQTMSGLNY